MAEHSINFVEGEGISIQAGQHVDSTQWNVEIANMIYGLTGTDGQVLTITAGGELAWADAPAGGDPAADTLVWMPLTTVSGGVPELVWEADDSLVPTLVPL